MILEIYFEFFIRAWLFKTSHRVKSILYSNLILKYSKKTRHYKFKFYYLVD